MPNVTIRIDTRGFERSLDAVARKQLPFALAQAVNTLAFDVMRAERAAMSQVFAHPRPFTQRAVLVTKGTKASPVAKVYVRPEAAAYLDPYEEGGIHHLPGRGLVLLNPKNIRLDRYGQIRGKPRTIADRANTFAGVVQTKAGPVWGFWQRLKGKRGGPRLRLLARAGEALPVRKRLGFEPRARALVVKEAPRVLQAALTAALRTARG